MEALRCANAALGAAEDLAAELRQKRDQLIAQAAQSGHGYKRIARAGGVSRSRASRIARRNGVDSRTSVGD